MSTRRLCPHTFHIRNLRKTRHALRVWKLHRPRAMKHILGAGIVTLLVAAPVCASPITLDVGGIGLLDNVISATIDTGLKELSVVYPVSLEAGPYAEWVRHVIIDGNVTLREIGTLSFFSDPSNPTPTQVDVFTGLLPVFLTGGSLSDPQFDLKLAYDTLTVSQPNPNPVPEPPTSLLMGAGLMTLVSFRMWRLQQQRA